VGYQSCDDSTAQAGGFDVFRCFANARAYAATPAVVGVVGAVNSPCSWSEIPVLNQAPGGPVAMISASNTVTELTRAVGSGENLAQLYPTGERNYVRLAAADVTTAVSLASAARGLGHRRVAVLWDGEDESMRAFANRTVGALPGLGLELALGTSWNPRDDGFEELARRVATAAPDAVLLAGAAPPHADALLGDLRSALGDDVTLIAHDGFAGLADQPWAHGLRVVTYGVPNAALPPRGLQFLAELERTSGSQGPDLAAAYAAQAAELLLDAIARSDGTRASVTAELRAAVAPDGRIGPIRFDEHGDLVDAPATMFRVTPDGEVPEWILTPTSARTIG
jgi:branched-chain amino acid transport system substrate-binding protein